MTSRRINISSGFRQRDIYLPVGFCISKIPVCRLLQQSRGVQNDPHQKTEMSVKHIAYLLMIERCIKKIMRYSDMSMKLLYK